jgi:hypothetical protein
MKLEKRNAANLIYSMIALFFIAWFFTLLTKWGNFHSGYELGLATGQTFRHLLKDFVYIALIYSAILRRREQRA